MTTGTEEPVPETAVVARCRFPGYLVRDHFHLAGIPVFALIEYYEWLFWFMDDEYSQLSTPGRCPRNRCQIRLFEINSLAQQCHVQIVAFLNHSFLKEDTTSYTHCLSLPLFEIIKVLCNFIEPQIGRNSMYNNLLLVFADGRLCASDVRPICDIFAILIAIGHHLQQRSQRAQRSRHIVPQ